MLLNKPKNPLISIVIPVFNEEQSVENFIAKTKIILENSKIIYEMIFVDDGSNDNTWLNLISYAKKDDRISIIRLSRNFGKEAALSAGIDHANGDALIPIDVDLQDPPDLIPILVENWKNGYDIVYGVRQSRESDSYLKRVSASLFYRFFNYLSPLKIPEDAGDFRLIDRRVAEVLKRLPERNRFMKGLFSWVGFKTIGVPFDRKKRISGRSKWSSWKLWNFALDGIFSFSTIPLRLWTYVGTSIALLSFFYGSFIVLRTLIIGKDSPGYASMLTIILFLGGVQLISIGILGEYIGRLFIEAKNRPLYVVNSVFRKDIPNDNFLDD